MFILQEYKDGESHCGKKKTQRGNLPLSSYYVLLIQTKNQVDTHKSKDIWVNRVHLCRGHIKTYTAEKPLFGKYVGNVWCPPHARGNKENGVIQKDYSISSGITPPIK